MAPRNSARHGKQSVRSASQSHNFIAWFAPSVTSGWLGPSDPVQLAAPAARRGKILMHDARACTGTVRADAAVRSVGSGVAAPRTVPVVRCCRTWGPGGRSVPTHPVGAPGGWLPARLASACHRHGAVTHHRSADANPSAGRHRRILFAPPLRLLFAIFLFAPSCFACGASRDQRDHLPNRSAPSWRLFARGAAWLHVGILFRPAADCDL
uniref:Uncharacterized protein n=1 Tax=Setaria viridis TaxID=4556 RepID=A0A4U6VBV4_SETVI|nr:hypothetical protein SEVIR_3G165766v2 [Setaria viridis]